MKEEKTLEEQKRYFYQQDPTTAVISWSWTFIILIIGVVIWLEITHFQWITAAFLVAFFAVAALAVFRRLTRFASPALPATPCRSRFAAR